MQRFGIKAWGFAVHRRELTGGSPGPQMLATAAGSLACSAASRILGAFRQLPTSSSASASCREQEGEVGRGEWEHQQHKMSNHCQAPCMHTSTRGLTHATPGLLACTPIGRSGQ